MSLEAVLVACVATVGVDAGLASAPHRVDKRRKEGLGDLLPLSCKDMWRGGPLAMRRPSSSQACSMGAMSGLRDGQGSTGMLFA